MYTTLGPSCCLSLSPLPILRGLHANCSARTPQHNAYSQAGPSCRMQRPSLKGRNGGHTMAASGLLCMRMLCSSSTLRKSAPISLSLLSAASASACTARGICRIACHCPPDEAEPASIYNSRREMGDPHCGASIQKQGMAFNLGVEVWDQEAP